MAEGHRLDDIRIENRLGITYDGEGMVLTGVHYLKFILATDSDTGFTSLFNHKTQETRYLHFHVNSQQLYATLHGALVTVSNYSVEFRVPMSQSGQNEVVSTLAESRLHQPIAYVQLIDGVWLLSDTMNSR